MKRILLTGKVGQACRHILEQSLLSSIKGIFKIPRHEVAVVIPLYKSEFNHYEEVSLDRCFHVLSHHPIIVIKPARLDVSCLLEKGYEFQTLDFPDECFKSVDSYSRMLLSRFFYESFLDYKYILIHQTDAFVFRDDLLKWCNAGFDYIGAPWLGQTWPMMPRSELDRLLNKTTLTRRLRKPRLVGNGGFSLRKVRSSVLALILLNSAVKKFDDNEDMFWSLDVSRKLPFFRIPDVKVAAGFSLEVEPREAIMLNNGQLPFGCHAWEKWDIEFWRPHFREFGYEI